MARRDTRNIAHYWVPGSIAGLSLLRADFTTHEYAAHSHDAFVVAVTEAGGAEIRSRGRAEQATARTVFVSNPAEPQSARLGASPRWRYRAFYLGQPTIEAVARALGVERLPHFSRSMIADPDLVDDFLALHETFETGADTPRCRELFVDAVGRLFRRHGSRGGRIPEPPRDAALLRRSAEHIVEHFAERLSVTDIGRVVGLTPFQVIGLFRRTIGLTPHAYLTQVRLTAARALLERGVPIAVAACDCGFYDQSGLSRHFKRCYGITPLQFVRAARASSSRSSADPREPGGRWYGAGASKPNASPQATSGACR